MPEATTPNSATPATPQAGGATVTPPAPGGPTTPSEPLAGDDQNISLEEARKLRSEAANLRKRMKTYEDAEAAAQQAAMTEAQKATKRADDAEAKIKTYQQQLVTAHVKLAAQAKGIIDPDLAALALQSQLEYGDDGMPSNLEKALADLIKNKPYLVAANGTQPPVSPAQTAQGQGQNGRAPAVPAMNPGRSSIQQPTQLPPGQRRRLSELL